MSTSRLVLGAVLAIAGAVWTLQGFNATFVPTSFMTGSGAWIVIGLATVVAGIAVAVSGRR